MRLYAFQNTIRNEIPSTIHKSIDELENVGAELAMYMTAYYVLYDCSFYDTLNNL